MIVYPDKKKYINIKKKDFSILNNSKKKKPPLSKKNGKIIYKTIYLNTQNKDKMNNLINTNKKINGIMNKKNILNLSNINKNHYYNNSIENELKKNSPLFSIKNFKKNFINNYYANYYDINNNNYFFNLYNSSTSQNSKYKGRNPGINKNFYKNINDRKLTFNSRNINLNKTMNTNIYKNDSIINDIDDYSDRDYLNTSVTIEMMKSYRNKLLIEFLKYLKKFYINYYKKYFILFINKLKSLPLKKSSKKFIYSKKIQKTKAKISTKKISKTLKVEKKIDKIKMQKNKIFINRRNNSLDKSLNLSHKKIDGSNIVSKIINNQTNELLNGKIRNIFLDSSFLKEVNNEQDNQITESLTYKDNKNINEKLNKQIISNNNNDKKENENYNREIKLFLGFKDEFKNGNDNKSSLEGKIYIRNNYIIFNENNKIKDNVINKDNKIYNISNLVNSFSIICKKEKNNIFEGRKKYLHLIENNKLSSIKEEDEKYSLSIQDSIIAENTKMILKQSNIQDNINNSHFNQFKLKLHLKLMIEDFYEEKYKKKLINKIKVVAFTYKINKVFNKNKEENNDKE